MKKRFTVIMLAAALALMLLPTAALAAGDVTVKINGGTAAEYPSLDAAIAAGGKPLADITSIEFTGGEVEDEDWDYIKSNNASFTSLLTLTVTGGVTAAADLPAGFLDIGSALPLVDVSIDMVNGIGIKAFGSCSSLTTVSFPKATGIDPYAFSGCSSLTTASFPEATSISIGAFQDCSSLTTASFPKATSINKGAFWGCSRLAVASFPKVTYIDESAFRDCSALASLSLPKAPPTVDQYWVFDGCPSTRYLTLVDANGNALTGSALSAAIAAYDNDTQTGAGTPGDGMWFGWTLRTVPIGGIIVKINGGTAITEASLEAAISASGVALAQITSIEITGGEVEDEDWDYIRRNRTSLTSLLTLTVTDGVTAAADLPKGFLSTRPVPPIVDVNIHSVKGIAIEAFFGCLLLKTASFPEATSIGRSVFTGCSSLATVSFPEATSIGDMAFQGCSALAALSLPNTPPTVSAYLAFDGCPSPRYLALVDANGNALTGSELDAAYAAYDNDTQPGAGTTGDGMWFGWTLLRDAEAPGITGDTTMTVDVGYADTSTNEYTITGNPVPTVTISAADPKITWNAATKQIDIAAGLGFGSYTVRLTAMNGISPNATLDLALTVVPTYGVSITNGTSNQSRYREGATVDITADPPPTGYRFKEWTSPNKINFADSTAAVTSFIMPGEDTTITATFEPKTYTVSLDRNGGDADGSVTATYNAALPAFAALTRSSHTLNGYYTTASGGSMVVDASGALQANVSGYSDSSGNWIMDAAATLHAQWTPVSYTISFTTRPVDAIVTEGQIAHKLTAAASVTPSGTATLDWYACDARGAISGGSLYTGGDFDIPTTLTEGTYYYLCQATHTGAAAINSNVAKVTVKRTHIDPSPGGNRITGIKSGQVYTQGDAVSFTAFGAGSDNLNPDDNDMRYTATYWFTNPGGDFSSGMTQSFPTDTMSLGAHTLTVEFVKQRYLNGQWTDLSPSVTDAKAVTFTLQARQTPPAPPRTGDDGKPFVWLTLCLICGAGIAAFAWRRRRRA